MKNFISKKLRKPVSAILAAAMSLSLFTAIPVSADIGRTTYNYDGYSVDYNVTNEWDGAQTVELTVSNTGTDSILNWALKYDAEGEISNLWNADLYEQNGDEYVIKNVGWNFEIAPSQSVTYGYTLSGNDLTLPENFEIYSKRVDKTEGYDVQYNITKSWDVGVEGNIVITNTSAAPIEAWTLSFDSNFTVDNLWNGRALENNGMSYTVAAEMWTNPVQPNGSMTIGFVGSKAADVEALLSNFRLTEVVIGEGMPVTPIDPPAEEIEITANAVYNKESGNITVSWNANNPNGTFDILMSEDGNNFISISVVEDNLEYTYTPNDFEILYFKVKQVSENNIVESNIATICYYIDCYDTTDTDGDGLPDFMEVKYGTDINNPDSDNDGLPDGYEVLSTNTNPLKYDSDDNGVCDADEDFDNDGLSNFKEYNLNTIPVVADSDNDGLIDYEEVNNILTNPLIYDTDNDGVSDGDELLLGLDPNNPQTFGTPDAEYATFQKITYDNKVLSKINGEGQPYSMSIDIEAAGVAENNISITPSGVSNTMYAYGVLGIMPEISYDSDLLVKNMTINFSIDENFIPEYDSKNEFDYNFGEFNNELIGIKRLNVFKYNETMNAMLPIKTVVDEVNNVLIAEDVSCGTFCVMDMVWWLRSFDITLEDLDFKYEKNNTTFSLFNSKIENDESVSKISDRALGCADAEEIDGDGNLDIDYPLFYQNNTMLMSNEQKLNEYIKKGDLVDIVFALQANGTQPNLFELQKQSIIEFGNKVYEYIPNSRIKILQCVSANKYLDMGWINNKHELSEKVNNINYIINNTDRINSGLYNAYYDAIYNTEYRNDAIIFPIWTWNTWHKDNAIIFNNSNAKYNELILGNYELYGNSTGLFIADDKGVIKTKLTTACDAGNSIFDFVYDKCVKPYNNATYNVIISSGVKKIVLDAPINQFNINDYDGDGVTDYDETIHNLIEWDKDGNIKKLPTFDECLNAYGDNKTRLALERYFDDFPNEISQKINTKVFDREILPVNSNPMAYDTDLDGYSDGDEKKYGTDPFRFNILLSSNYITDLSGNYYYSTSCKEEYDGNALQWILVGIGNHIYGANHDYSKIYRDSLLNYFNTQNNSILNVQQSVQAVNTWSNVISQFVACAEVGIDVSRNNYFDELSNLYIVINEYTRQLNGIKYKAEYAETISKYASTCIKEINTNIIRVNNVTNKINMENSIFINVKKYAGDNSTNLCRILYFGMGFVDMVSDAIIFDSISTVMQENIDVIKYTMFYSDYDLQRSAASRLYSDITSSSCHALDSAFIYLSSVANYGIDGEGRIAFAKLCPLATSIVAGVAINDLIFNVSGTSKSIISTIGDAMIGNILSDKLVNSANSHGCQLNVNTYYAVYENNIDYTMMLFSNLVCFRIYGEKSVSDSMTSYNWAVQYYLSKVWKIDCTDVIVACNDNIIKLRNILQNYS